MTYEELNARLNAIDSKIDGLLSLMGKMTESKQCEIMDIAAITDKALDGYLEEGRKLYDRGDGRKMATVLCRTEAQIVYVSFTAYGFPIERRKGGIFFDFRQIIPEDKSIIVVIHIRYSTLVCEKL